jgi:hypothetical protein
VTENGKLYVSAECKTTKEEGRGEAGDTRRENSKDTIQFLFLPVKQNS